MPFAQAAVSAMERCALFVFRYLSPKTAQQLADALHEVRYELKLPAPVYPLLDCRDWPHDADAAAALGVLLKSLGRLEQK